MTDKENKLKNVQFLKDFNKITVTKACIEENVKDSNLYTLKASKESIQRIKDNIDRKIKELYEVYDEDSSL